MGATSKHLNERQIRAALELTDGNRGKAAELLGVDRVTLWRQMKRLGISASWAKDAA